jgi:hypothetical protein
MSTPMRDVLIRHVDELVPIYGRRRQAWPSAFAHSIGALRAMRLIVIIGGQTWLTENGRIVLGHLLGIMADDAWERRTGGLPPGPDSPLRRSVLLGNRRKAEKPIPNALDILR